MRKTLLYMAGLSIFIFQACESKKSKNVESSTETATEAATETPNNEKQRVYFISPADGDAVENTFKVVMGVEGMAIEPAGEVNEGFGHHHVLINMSGWPEGEIIPPSDTTIHFGKGQTETELTLDPGPYTISLQFADGVHRSYGESMSASIKVNVQE